MIGAAALPENAWRILVFVAKDVFCTQGAVRALTKDPVFVYQKSTLGMDNENFNSEELTSERGSKYAVSSTEAGMEDPVDFQEMEGLEANWAKNKEIGQRDADGFIKVHWQFKEGGCVSGSLNVPNQIHEIGLHDISLDTDVKLPYQYMIRFRNDKGWGFKFKDASGDVYSISTLVNRFHLLHFDSPNPTIVGVK